MALINCPECGARISDKALSCPNCGHPMIAEKKKGSWQPMNIWWMSIAVIALVVALFSLINSCHWKPVI
jgi:hypothetical protein